MMSSLNHTSSSGFDDGTLWGPQSGGSFDFTPRFEQTVFTLIPGCVLIACSPYYVWKIYNGSRLVKWGYLFWLKLTTSLMLLACALALAITGQMLSPFRTALGLASSTIACLSAVCVLVIICAEHAYSIHPSHLLGLFLAITALLDSAIAYSLFRHNVLVQGSLAAAVVAAKALLLCLEEISKRRLFINSELKEEAGKEATSGFWGKAFYVWLNATFWKGYKSTLTLDDLDQLNKNLKTQQLCDAFRDHWSKAAGNSHHRLLWCLLKTIGPMHLAINAIVCLLSVASKFAQPFIIQKVVAAMVEPDLDYNIRASLIGATVLAYFSFAVTRVVNQQLLARSTIAFRSCSIVVIFEKLMTLDANTVRQSGVMTLITADVTGFQALPLRINNLISYVASIAGGMAYLALNIGEAAVLVVIPIFACSIVSYVLVKRIKDAQQKWNLKIESRVAAIQTMLKHFKSMKMIGLSSWFFRFINDNLKVEIDASRKLRHYNSIIFGLDLTSIALTPVIVLLGTYCWTRQDGLATADVYALLAVSSMIADPLGQLVQVFSQIARPLACHDRIQKFLSLDNLVDMRSRPGVGDPSQVMSEKMATTAAYIELEAAAATMQGLDTTPLVDGRQILQAVDVIFPKGKLTIVTGDVGSGKSTVLRLLLGEVATSKGRVQIDKSTTGFCGQVPWLYNQSVKDNIIGPNPYADEWYKTVTSACGLTADFEQWPLGDNTNAGDSGSSLSGGQKQRISLARAIYARKPLLLLDDVLSGLDAQTAHRIFDALLGKAGILRRSNTTVILATNLAEYLPSADLVLRIDGKAIVSESNACPSTESMSQKGETQLNGDSSMASSNEFVEKAASSPQATDASVTLHDLRETGSKSKTKVSKKRSAHFSYFQSFGVVRITIWLILAAFGELFFKTPNIFLRLWFQDHESSDKRFLIGYSVISIFAILFCAIYIWWFLAGLIANSYQQLHDTLLQTTMRSTSRFIAATGAGSILNRFSQDVGFISQDLPYAFLHAMMYIFALIVDLGIIASGADYAAVIIPAFIVFLVFLQRFYLFTSRQIRLLQLEAMTPIYTLVTEVISGVEHIRAFGWQSFLIADFIQHLDNAQTSHYQMICLQQWLFLVLDLTVLGLATLVVSLALCVRDKASANGLGLALVNMIAFSQGMSIAIRQWAECETSLGAVTRIHEFENSAPTEPTSASSNVKLSQSWPEKGDIEFTNISIRYDPEEENSPNVLTNVTFAAEHGQKIGIVGRSGSGKSSLMMAILQMGQHGGTITLDGVDLATVPCELLRSRVTTISQDTVVLQTSIRSNMYPYTKDDNDKVDDNIMIDVLKQIGLWQYLEAHDGLDACIGTLQLSEGQLQLLNIARGMVHHSHTKSKLVLMDEITSQLDYTTDKRVQEAVKTIFNNCTMLVIAHRTDTLKDMDLILTLANGQANVTPQTPYWSQEASPAPSV